MTSRVQQTSLLSWFKGQGKAMTMQKSCLPANVEPMPEAENDSNEHPSKAATLCYKQPSVAAHSQGPFQGKTDCQNCEKVQYLGRLDAEKDTCKLAAAWHQDGVQMINAPALPLGPKLGPGLRPCQDQNPHEPSPNKMPVKRTGAEARELSIQGAKRKRVEVPGPSQELETDLERQRAENIRRNEDFLASLGIESNFLVSKKAQTGAQPKQARKIAPPLQMPVRRSTRARVAVAESNSSLVIGSLTTPGIEPEKELEPLHYDDSSVRRYTCRMQGEGVTEECSDSGFGVFDALQPTGVSYCDPLMTRVYALDAREGSSGGVLAAGGHAGRLAVFGLRETAELVASDCARVATQGDDDMGTEHGAAEEPLLAWKGGSGWISAVQFLTRQQQEGATLLLTSSNDRSVVLWDIDKTSNATGTPRIVGETSSLHSNGIFGMHERDGQIATASKDKTVGITAVGEAGLEPLTVLSGHHSAAVRAVHFRDSHHLADGSADCSVAVSDLRLADPGSLCIENAHDSAVNVVQWHPTNERLLMSASHDRGVRLHDIRAPQQPLFTFAGHLGATLARSKSIYRPSFLGAGRYLASPGEGSQAISLYDVASGKTVSRGCLGFDATMTMAGKMGRHLWVAAQGGVVQKYRGSLSAATL